LNHYLVRVSAAILRPRDEVLALRQLDRGLERIALPGGTADLNESLEEALVREVREETGCEVLPSDIACVAEGYNDRWSQPTLDVCFYARMQGRVQAPERLGEYIVGIEWMALDDPSLLTFVPHVAGFKCSRRGRYVDETGAFRRKKAAWNLNGPS